MTLRAAQQSDYPAFVALFPELRVDELVPDEAKWWATLGPQTLVIDEHGLVVAYVYFQILARTGYIRHVVVHPDHRGRGLGLQLLNAVAERLRAAGCTTWCLNVKPDNTAALGLYQRVGMRTAYSSAAVRFTWDLVDRLPNSDMSIRTCRIDPAEDAALERALNLPQGQLANHRLVATRIDLRLHDPADPQNFNLGLASFVPSFPGAFPFRVARPSLARPLLAGMRTHALPHLDHVQVVTEGDQPLLDLLVANGARIHMTFLHLAGPVPFSEEHNIH